MKDITLLFVAGPIIALIGYGFGIFLRDWQINDACINLGMFEISEKQFTCDLSSVKSGEKVFFVVPENDQ